MTPAESLAALEARIAATDAPDLLVALAADVEQIGAQLARAFSQATDPAQVTPLKPLMMRVPIVAGGALLRAAERYDDRGDSRRAAAVLFRALRDAIDRDLLRALALALAFILDAHDFEALAARVGTHAREFEEQRAAKVPLREARTTFQAAIDAVQQDVNWDALPDHAENVH